MAKATVGVDLDPREPDLLHPVLKPILMAGLAVGSAVMLLAFVIVTLVALL
ncbi:MAG: hypothetical protein ACOY4K_17000 [Pseudomonadota bacterium]